MKQITMTKFRRFILTHFSGFLGNTRMARSVKFVPFIVIAAVMFSITKWYPNYDLVLADWLYIPDVLAKCLYDGIMYISAVISLLFALVIMVYFPLFPTTRKEYEEIHGNWPFPFDA